LRFFVARETISSAPFGVGVGARFGLASVAVVVGTLTARLLGLLAVELVLRLVRGLRGALTVEDVVLDGRGACWVGMLQ
jgi:hypothetical protein